MKVVYLIIGAVLQWVLTIESYALKMVATLFDFFIKSLDRNIATFDAVQLGWITVRDVFNMFFIFFLLIIAFATILRIQNWQYKQLLPRLIIAILLVNFSRTICAFFIEVSNVLMRTFTLGLGDRGLSAQLAANLGLNDLTNIGSGVPATSITDAGMASGMFMLAAFVGVFILALTAVCVLLLTRVVALMFLTVLSPAAFVLNILPKTQQYANKWWEEFLKYIIYGPAATFFVYLAVKTSANLKLNGAFKNFSHKQIAEVAGRSSGDAWLLPTNFDMDAFLGFSLVTAILFGTVILVKGLGSFGSAALLGAATGVLGKGLRLGTKAPFAPGGYFAGRSLMKGKDGLIGKAFGLIPGLGAALIAKGRGLDAGKAYNDMSDKAGDAVRFASPTLMMDAARNIRSDLDRRAKRGASGYVEDRLGSLFGMTSDSYQQDINAGIQEQKKNMLVRNPSKSPDALIHEVKSSLGRNGSIKDMDQAQAGYELLLDDNMIGSLYSAAEDDDNLRTAMFGKDYEKTDHFKRNGYKNNISNRIKTMENMFGSDMAKRIADNYGGAMIGQGAYDWVGMTEFKNGKREWAGDDTSLTGEDLENYREKKVGEVGARLASKRSFRERGNIANTTAFVDGAGSPELGRHEFERAVGGFHNAQSNQVQWKNMSDDKKVLSENPDIQQQRTDNAALSMLLNHTFDGKKIGSNTYRESKGINGASWDMTVNAGVNNMSRSDIDGSLRTAFDTQVSNLVNDPSGTKKLEGMLKKLDPEHFAVEKNRTDAIAEMKAKNLAGGMNSYVNKMFDTVKT